MNANVLKASLCALFLFFSAVAFAQQNFVKGFTVSLKGDTTYGLINYRNWRKTPTSIQFKKEADATLISYTAKDIAFFGINLPNGREIYKAATVSIETSSKYLDHLDTQRAFNERTDNLFLLALLKGTYNLYVYEDEKEHYFIENGDEITELRFKTYYMNDKNIAKNEQFKNQLANFLKNCPKITELEILNLVYGNQALIKILKKYDECTNVRSEENLTKEGTKLSFGAVLASDIARLSMKRDNRPESAITSAGNFAVGLSMELKLPRNNRSSSFNIEALYRRYKFEERVDNFISNDEYFKYHRYFVGNYAKVNFMYRYQFTAVKLKPFLNVGFSEAFKFSDIDRSTTEKKSYTAITTYKDPFILKEKSHEEGVNLGAGINISKINIELRAESTNGYSHILNAKTSINSLFLNLNYIFK